jgi:oxazoline/thiazoline synthase
MNDQVIDRRGGFRSVGAEETLAKWQHLISPITGVVTSIFEMPSEDGGVIHNVVAGHNFAMDTKNITSLKKGLRSKSAGKGTSIQQARAGALCEAVERYSGLFTGEEYRITSSFNKLGLDAIHPNACMLFSDMQYQDRAQNNLRDRSFEIIPDPFDVNAEIEWSPVWSLTHKTYKWLPTGYLYFAYPRKEGQFFYWGDSNGSAAGNTLEEAVLQGFLEIVERDAAAIWWYNQLSLPSIDLPGLNNAYINQVIDHYKDINREIWCLDLTTDIGIPVIAAITRRIDKPVEDIVFAFGCHLDFEIAVLRAITELNQFLPAVIPMKTDGTGEYAYDDPASLEWWKTALLVDHPYLAPNSLLPKVGNKPAVIATSGSIGEIVLSCQKLIEQRGYEFLVLNQTRPDIGLPVVKVIIPGMRHFWRRCAPGRLYDVPVELGLLKQRKSESELNPIGIFI